MKTKLFLIVITGGLALCGCEKKPVAEWKPPTVQESFRAAETNGFENFDSVGRFVPMNVTGQTVILDTKLGNVFYLNGNSWVKITSPMGQNFEKQTGFVAPPQDLVK